MVSAGKLDRRFRFFARKQVSNGAGGTRGEWEFQFEQAGHRGFLRGGESVLAARLESRQPAILTIRKSNQAGAITNDWQVQDTRDGRIYNIRENPKESDDRGFLEMLVEAGVS